MAVFLSANNATTTLAAALTSGATTITLAAGTGSLFPSPGAGQFFSVTLNDVLTGNRYEICYCTARTGDSLTVSRGQEGTTAQAWLIGDFAYRTLTAQQENLLVQVGNLTSSLLANGYKKISDPNAPGGYLIEQWGAINAADNTTTEGTFPIAFPSACIFFICNVQASITSNTYAVGGQFLSPTHFEITNTNPGTSSLGVSWLAKGY